MGARSSTHALADLPLDVRALVVAFVGDAVRVGAPGDWPTVVTIGHARLPLRHLHVRVSATAVLPPAVGRWSAALTRIPSIDTIRITLEGPGRPRRDHLGPLWFALDPRTGPAPAVRRLQLEWDPTTAPPRWNPAALVRHALPHVRKLVVHPVGRQPPPYPGTGALYPGLRTLLAGVADGAHHLTALRVSVTRDTADALLSNPGFSLPHSVTQLHVGWGGTDLLPTDRAVVDVWGALVRGWSGARDGTLKISAPADALVPHATALVGRTLQPGGVARLVVCLSAVAHVPPIALLPLAPLWTLGRTVDVRPTLRLDALVASTVLQLYSSLVGVGVTSPVALRVRLLVSGDGACRDAAFDHVCDCLQNPPPGVRVYTDWRAAA